MRKALFLGVSISLASQSLAQVGDMMDDDDRRGVVFSSLQGTLTYTGNSESVLSELDGFTTNDLNLIQRSASDKSYTRDSMAILIDACEYFEQTPRGELDVSYLIESGYRSHDLELENQKQFWRDLYAELSPSAKAKFDEKFDVAHVTANIGKSDIFRANPDSQMTDNETQAFLDNFSRGCANVRRRFTRMEENNWIEEPSITSIEYKGAGQ